MEGSVALVFGCLDFTERGVAGRFVFLRDGFFQRRGRSIQPVKGIRYLPRS